METSRYTQASEIGDEAARSTWALAAREVLITTAGSYHAVITYKELAALVQERALIRTDQRTHYWIGDVLGRVARDCAARNEPMLSSLCVDATGSVGKGYAAAVGELRDLSTVDADDHAAQERLLCYRHFEADLPKGGGVPALTPQLRERRDRAFARVVVSDKMPTICATCNMALPASGQCDYCD